jgi:Tfp pilus assembly protein PilO
MADLNQLLRKAEFSLRRLTWQTQAGLALLVIGFLLAIVLIGGELTKQRHLNVELANPIKQTLATTKKISSSDLTQRFYVLLPKNAETDALSERILQLADGMGLVFERAEFSATQNADSALIQHQIKLPVKGSYVQIRQFLNTLFNEQATLALTEMQIRREDVFTDMVEANLVLTLYLRKDVK